MSDGYVTLNAGSSSIKFSLFLQENDELTLVSHGELEEINTRAHFIARDRQHAIVADQCWNSGKPYHETLADLISWIESHLAPARLAAVGHRVVHGGTLYTAPVFVTLDVINALALLNPLAPLHQPHNLLPIRELAKSHPGLPQVACFDTAFHVTNPRISRLYALPRALTEQGVVHYGFHGLSYEYIAGELPEHEPRARGRVIVAHLGNGASMCAMVNGQSVASTMGFSTLAGLPMGTRSGDIDPGILLYLLQEKNMALGALENMLYRESGLLGVSAVSSDMRELLQSEDLHARDAVDLFVYRIVREIGSLAAAAGGVDVLVFTAGIGEHAPEIRARVCAQIAWLGVDIDAEKNTAGDLHISTQSSAVSVWTLPANEEIVIARHTRKLVAERQRR